MSAPESYEEGNKSYGESARWLARQYLILLDENYEGNLYDEVKRMTRWQEYGFYRLYGGMGRECGKIC